MINTLNSIKISYLCYTNAARENNVVKEQVDCLVDPGDCDGPAKYVVRDVETLQCRVDKVNTLPNTKDYNKMVGKKKSIS